MGIRCTVLGHDWGEVGVERDRQEDGDEVVVTVREVRTCSRCDDEEVLGESMEVTSIGPSEAEPDPEERAVDPDDGAPTHPSERGTDDGDYGDPADDDGVILDERDDGGTDERGPGEWPEAPEREAVPEESEPWPDTATEDDVPETDERFVGADETRADPEPSGGEVLDDDGEAAARDPTPEADHVTSDAPADDAGGTADLTPDDDGIIEAGGGDEASDSVDAGDDEASDSVDAGGDEASDSVDAGDDDASDGVEVPDAEAGTSGDAGDAATSVDDATPTEAPDGSADTAEDVGAEEDGAHDGAVDDPAEEPEMGADATTRPEDDAEVLEATESNEQSRATAEEPVDPEGGATSDHLVASDADDDPSEAGADTSSGPPGSLDPSEPPSDAEPSPEDIVYYCPECGFVDDSEWPSRRAGDVCPDCRRSYLAEREA